MDLHSGRELLYLLSVWCPESIELTSYAVANICGYQFVGKPNSRDVGHIACVLH